MNQGSGGLHGDEHLGYPSSALTVMSVLNTPRHAFKAIPLRYGLHELLTIVSLAWAPDWLL